MRKLGHRQRGGCRGGEGEGKGEGGFEGIFRLQPSSFPGYHKVNRTYLLPTNMYLDMVVLRATGQIIRGKRSSALFWEPKRFFSVCLSGTVCVTVWKAA